MQLSLGRNQTVSLTMTIDQLQSLLELLDFREDELNEEALVFYSEAKNLLDEILLAIKEETK